MQTFADSRDPELRLYNEGEAALILGVTKRATQAWRKKGGGPPFVKLSGRAIRYRASDLIKFIQDRTYGSTSEY